MAGGGDGGADGALGCAAALPSTSLGAWVVGSSTTTCQVAGSSTTTICRGLGLAAGCLRVAVALRAELSGFADGR